MNHKAYNEAKQDDEVTLVLCFVNVSLYIIKKLYVKIHSSN